MLDQLRSIVQRVSATADLRESLRLIVEQVQDALAVQACSIYLRDPQGHRLWLCASHGLRERAIGQVSLAQDEGLVGLVATREEPLNVDRALDHPNYRYLAETGEEKYRSFLGVPIIHHRRVLGVLVVQRAQAQRFDESEEAFLITLSAQLSGTIAHSESTGDLAQLIHPEDPDSHETDLRGLPGAPGIAIGEAVIISPVADLFALDAPAARSVATELAEYRRAVEKTRHDIAALAQGLSGQISEQEQWLFTAYAQMLDDQSLGKEVKARIRAGAAAQAAWSAVIIAHVRQFETMQDSYLQERAADLRDLGRRVLAHMQESEQQQVAYPANAILVGEELSVATLGTVSAGRIAGLLSVQGSVNSHLAILARAMGIPTVLGIQGLRLERLRGQRLIVDGYSGHVYVAPTAEHLAHYRRVLAEDRQLLAELEGLRDAPAVTLDAHPIKLLVNTGLLADVRISLERGAEGVGLYRSEVPFFARQRFPTEEEQRQFYREQLLAFAPRPVVMRTLDVGGDKNLPYFPIDEANPFLGWRGIRITLDHPELFLAQLRAMLKASAGLRNLRILLPMISSLSELEMALELIERAHHELTAEEGLDIHPPRIGVMIEVPSAIFLARDLARRVDFLSVGSNDLTQYILAVDRNNSQVADLYQSMHPAVLAACYRVVRAAHAEGKIAGVCGELAGNPLGALLLLAMGYDSLSMNASNLLRVKALIRGSRLSELKQLLRHVLKLPDAESVRRVLNESITDPQLRRFAEMAPGLG
ncbi:MAG: phosphoenolpyruvate--protein phosphotransferase [Cellvibrionales bacterium]|nr:phosphoenolpyruvate--protein phosphotransferase [Cellvibrionales bacterium]